MSLAKHYYISNNQHIYKIKINEKDKMSFRQVAEKYASKLQLKTGKGYYFGMHINYKDIHNLDEIMGLENTNGNIYYIHSIKIPKEKKMINFKIGEVVFSKEVSLEDIYDAMGEEYNINIGCYTYSNYNAYMPLKEGEVYEFIKK